MMNIFLPNKAREKLDTEGNIYSSKRLREIFLPEQYSEELKKLRTVLESADVMTPVNVSDYKECSSRELYSYLLLRHRIISSYIS